MPRKQVNKIKITKGVKKSTSRKSKRLSPKVEQTDTEVSAVLPATKISGTSATHGHTPYEHTNLNQAAKKLDERSKNLIMYIGVGLVMVIIVVFWIINLKRSLGPDSFSLKPPESKSQTSFDDLKNDLNKTLSEVKGEINTLEEKAKEKPITPTSTSTFIPTNTATPTSAVAPSSTFKPVPVTDTIKTNLPNTLP